MYKFLGVLIRSWKILIQSEKLVKDLKRVMNIQCILNDNA